MRFIIAICLLFPMAPALFGQTYAEGIEQFRAKYIADLLAEKREPVKPSQVKFITFYPPDPQYSVTATFTETPGSKPFMVPTHSGKNKPFREYGALHFKLGIDTFTLHAYQMVNLLNDATEQDELFIMFNDETNYETTYAGGRYIDLSVKDIHDGKILLDFNKCYNPYCAYSEGFSCPIPPAQNQLHTPIMAGEKMFLHQ